MAKRFIDTNFFKSPYVRGLEGPLKSLYGFIICDCDSAGIWVKDLEIASIYIGFQISEDKWENQFIKNGKAIDVGGGKFFFPDFIQHQYPKGLSEKNPAHKTAIETLKKMNLIEINKEGAIKVLSSPFEGTQVMVMVKEKEKEKEKEEVKEKKQAKKEKPTTLKLRAKKIVEENAQDIYGEVDDDEFLQIGFLIEKIKSTIGANLKKQEGHVFRKITDEEVLEEFEFLLLNLPEFYKSMFSIKSINNNYKSIISKIKSGNNEKSNIEKEMEIM